jgi:hypothetical protein
VCFIYGIEDVDLNKVYDIGVSDIDEVGLNKV